jgi:hypothetical protein
MSSTRDSRKKKEVDRLLRILKRKRDVKIKKVTAKVPKIKRKTYRSRQPKMIQTFIQENKLEPGKYFFRVEYLYYFFRHWWSLKQKMTKCNLQNFTRLIKLYMHFRVNKHGMIFFGINKDLRETYLTAQREAAIARRLNEKEEGK